MHKLMGFRILVQPVDDCLVVDDEEKRIQTLKHALEALEAHVRPLIQNGYQIIAFGAMPTTENIEKELS